MSTIYRTFTAKADLKYKSFFRLSNVSNEKEWFNCELENYVQIEE